MVEAYKQCGRTLADKLPLTNKFIRSVAAIHPDARGHSSALKLLQNLPTVATNVLSDEEEDAYDKECRLFQADKMSDIGDDERIDHWWGHSDISKRFPSLSKMVRALLSCFHGPQVEASFSAMTDIIDAKSNRLSAETFSAIQTVRYGISASGKSAVEFFQKKDFLHERVDGRLCKNMVSACKNYKEELEEKQRQQEERKVTLNVKKQTAVSKRKAKEIHTQAVKRARTKHYEKQLEKAKLAN